MLQLGNLAIVCAKRNDVSMLIYRGIVTIHVGHGPYRGSINIDWHDNEKMEQTIRELNNGKYAEKRKDNAA